MLIQTATTDSFFDTMITGWVLLVGMQSYPAWRQTCLMMPSIFLPPNIVSGAIFSGDGIMFVVRMTYTEDTYSNLRHFLYYSSLTGTLNINYEKTNDDFCFYCIFSEFDFEYTTVLNILTTTTFFPPQSSLSPVFFFLLQVLPMQNNILTSII